MKTLAHIAFFASLALSLFHAPFIAHAQSRQVDGIVAIVNKDVITRSELTRQMTSIERQMSRNNVSIPPRNILQQQVLDRMVMDRAQLQRAEQLGIRVQDKDIEATMTRIAQQGQLNLESFLDNLSKDGITAEQFREDVKNELTLTRLREREVERKLQVSDSEIQAWLANRSQGELSVKPQVNWIQLLVKAPKNSVNEATTRTVQELESALGAGASVEEAVDPEEIARFMGKYKEAAGTARDTLNASPSIIASG